VPVRLSIRKQKSVIGVQMSRMRTIFDPVMQSGSDAMRSGSSGKVGRAACVGEGSRQCRSARLPPPLGSQMLQYQRKPFTIARASRDAAESLPLVIVTTRAAPSPAQAIVAHGVADVAARDVTTAKAGDGGDMWAGASIAKVEVATVDEVTIKEAEIWVDRDGVEVHPSMPALENEQSCVM
jgi:hypothetical protein